MIMKKTTKKTQQSGANAARSSIIAHIEYELKYGEWGRLIDGIVLIEWIGTMDERWNKRKGGLGK